MMVDGKTLAKTLEAQVASQVASLPASPRLMIFTCAPNFETKKYLDRKLAFAKRVGVEAECREMPEMITLSELNIAINAAVNSGVDGVVVQLPFAHLRTTEIVACIPRTHDVDAFSYTGEQTRVLPPVVGAIDYIANQHGVSFDGALVVVVGEGLLVGMPASRYASSRGAQVTTITKNTPNEKALSLADVVILGAGVPGLVTPEMLKEGVVVFDAGTSEEGGVLRGDADIRVSDKAALLTPVPGGIGPLTIAILFQNLVELILSRK